MKPLIVGNWKCNPVSIKEAKKLFSGVLTGTRKLNAEVAVCPPFGFIPLLPKSKKLLMGAQDCFWENKGAFTGEMSALMLKDLGCNYVISGHSERRKYFNETDEDVNKKVKAILENKLTPIFCIGETKEQRDSGEAEKVVERQIAKGLDGINKISDIIIAYEPVWAIGTGVACDTEEAQKMMLVIKKAIGNSKIRVIYGGSVNSKNAGGYIKDSQMNGLLVGGASLDAKEFTEIIKNSI